MLLVHRLLLTSPWADVLYAVVAGVAVLGVLVGVRRHRPVRRRAWWALAAGTAAWVAGDVTWVVLDTLGHDPFPSPADVVYLSAYPVLAVALHGLRPRGAGRDRAEVVEPLVVATGAALVLWVTMVEPTWTGQHASQLARLVATAYPVGDVVLLALVLQLALGGGARVPALRVLLAAFTATLAGDLVYQATGAAEAAAPVTEPLWLLGYLLTALAALHPSMRRIGAAGPPAGEGLVVGRVLLLAGSVLLLPATILVESALGVPTHTDAVSVAAVVLVVLVTVRMLGMVRQLQDQSRRLTVLADTDPLTGLENRRRFVERVTAAVRAADDADGPRSAVLVLGLEHRAELADTLGHRTGDRLLQAVATRLAAAVGPAPVARLGGDVLAVLVDRPAGDDGAAALEQAAMWRALAAEPVTVDGVTVTLGGAVGVTLLPECGNDPAEVIHRAEVALTAARTGRRGVARWRAEMQQGDALTPVLMAELDEAIANGEVLVHLQPQVDLVDGRVSGAEALVRWHHPEHGMLAPLQFVPAAERTGQVRRLTVAVLDQALGHAALLRRTRPGFTVSVNLSMRDLLDPDVVEDVRAALVRHGLDATALELEITETMAMVDPVRSTEVLAALAELGVLLSVDDYGVGYGSLAYLQRLPVRRLKIDRSFVRDVLADDASRAIVASTVDLATRLGLTVVAEGVEDDATLRALRDLGCAAAQGYGIARPCPPEELDDVVVRADAHVRRALAAAMPSPHVPVA